MKQIITLLISMSILSTINGQTFLTAQFHQSNYREILKEKSAVSSPDFIVGVGYQLAKLPVAAGIEYGQKVRVNGVHNFWSNNHFAALNLSYFQKNENFPLGTEYKIGYYLKNTFEMTPIDNTEISDFMNTGIQMGVALNYYLSKGKISVGTNFCSDVSSTSEIGNTKMMEYGFFMGIDIHIF